MESKKKKCMVAHFLSPNVAGTIRCSSTQCHQTTGNLLKPVELFQSSNDACTPNRITQQYKETAHKCWQI